jgi:hypothetical protein
LSDYQNDLSKVRFNCCRKSTTSIVLYDTHSSNYECPSDKESKPFEPKPSLHACYIPQHHKSLEDFMYHFAAIYHEHNFSKPKVENVPTHQHYQIMILDFYGHSLLPEFEKTENQDFQDLM